MMAARQQANLRGELRVDEPMTKHTSWRVGGPADRFYRPADLEDLTVFLASLPPGEPVFWCGLGSNLLVRDGGLRGTVIQTQGVSGLELTGETTLRAECGVPCAKVARFAAKHDLVGGEFLAGIPGTMGGALAMNAGAFGGETWERVIAVETVDSGGRLRRRPAEEFQVGYRSVRGVEGERFVAAELGLLVGSGAESLEHIRGLLARRAETQPMGKASCGSVFRNPPGDHAARLIEAAGLKGECVGKACVSEKHANFIINTGGARAADIETLIARVGRAVLERFGVELIPEVRVVGEDGK